MCMTSEKRSKIRKEISLMSFTVELAFILAVPMIVLAFLGHILDKAIDSGFLFLIIFTTVGIIISSMITVKKVTSILNQVNKDYEDLQKEDEEERE